MLCHAMGRHDRLTRGAGFEPANKRLQKQMLAASMTPERAAATDRMRLEPELLTIEQERVLVPCETCMTTAG